jgi:AmmeMemoRadiSam system protein A
MIELELPFILKALGKVKIVPVLFSRIDRNQIKKFALKLANISKRKNILVVISSDLSHYHSYADALRIDWDTIRLIKDQDSETLCDTKNYGGGRACGLDPIIALLDYSKQMGAKTKVLRYANSGDTAGMKQRVVGYLSAVSYKSKDTKKVKEGKKEKEMAEFDLTDAEKKNLLEIARSSLESYLREGKRLDVKPLNDKLKEKRGVFVTLKGKRSGQLRGCIGRMIGDQPLCNVVSEYAIHSALDDPRFPKVRPEELDELEIEISVLTPFVKVKNLDEIEVGKHGLMIQKGFQSGVLLPQVPIEWGWDRETFLQQVCNKAGLPSDAYKDKGANLYKFSAIVFSESDFESK